MKLIDADELSKEMYHEAFETETDMQRWDSGCWIRYKMFENKIADAPTVCDIDAIREEIEAKKEQAEILYGHALGFDTINTYNKVLQIIDKHIKGEQG